MIATTVSGDVAGSGGGNKTMHTILSAADRRPRIKKIIIGCTDGTLTDAKDFFVLRRLTADGTGTAVTPVPINIGDGLTPTLTSKKNYTVEPTYATGNIAEFPLHQRATQEFVPGAGEEWVAPIGAGAGLGLVLVTANTKNYRTTIVWDE